MRKISNHLILHPEESYILTKEDVGLILPSGFGYVLNLDVGKKITLKSYGLVMENDEQKAQREAAEAAKGEKP